MCGGCLQEEATGAGGRARGHRVRAALSAGQGRRAEDGIRARARGESAAGADGHSVAEKQHRRHHRRK